MAEAGAGQPNGDFYFRNLRHAPTACAEFAVRSRLIHKSPRFEQLPGMLFAAGLTGLEYGIGEG